MRGRVTANPSIINAPRAADITITTDADQTPIAPGYVRADVVKDGRRTVRFVSDAPINHFFSIQSGRYAIARDEGASLAHVKPHGALYHGTTEAHAVATCVMEATREVLGRVELVGFPFGALDVFAANDPAERRALWEARRLISPSLKEAHPIKIGEDVCVPRGAITAMLGRVDRIAAEVGLPIAVFGHAGDGNLHVNVVSDDDPADPASWAKVDRACARIFADAVDLRGTLSGEHGIGLIKRPYMHLEQSERVLEWQRRWKAMWDPLDLLNPGKLIPERRPTCSE